jgi:hypothetical protein
LLFDLATEPPSFGVISIDSNKLDVASAVSSHKPP